MKKNKLMIAMAATALLSSMGALADDADSFIAKYTVNDDITINIFEDEVALTSSNVSDVDGYARGSTEFCVGRVGADDGNNNGNFTVTVTSTNSYQLEGAGGDPLAYELHYTAGDAFDRDNLMTVDADQIEGTTGQNVTTCDGGTTAIGRMWVGVPPSSIDDAVTGVYSDTITMTVAPRS